VPRCRAITATPLIRLRPCELTSQREPTLISTSDLSDMRIHHGLKSNPAKKALCAYTLPFSPYAGFRLRHRAKKATEELPRWESSAGAAAVGTAMVSLKLQKRLAASVLSCGLRKVWLDPNEANDISMANSRATLFRALSATVLSRCTLADEPDATPRRTLAAVVPSGAASAYTSAAVVRAALSTPCESGGSCIPPPPPDWALTRWPSPTLRRAKHPEAGEGWLRDQEADEDPLARTRTGGGGGEGQGPPLRLR